MEHSCDSWNAMSVAAASSMWMDDFRFSTMHFTMEALKFVLGRPPSGEEIEDGIQVKMRVPGGRERYVQMAGMGRMRIRHEL